MSDHEEFKRMSQPELSRYMERLSNEYRSVIKPEEYFDAQTGVYAVLQRAGEGPETRKMVVMNSGVISDRKRSLPRKQDKRRARNS